MAATGRGSLSRAPARRRARAALSVEGLEPRALLSAGSLLPTVKLVPAPGPIVAGTPKTFQVIARPGSIPSYFGPTPIGPPAIGPPLLYRVQENVGTTRAPVWVDIGLSTTPTVVATPHGTGRVQLRAEADAFVDADWRYDRLHPDQESSEFDDDVIDLRSAGPGRAVFAAHARTATTDLLLSFASPAVAVEARPKPAASDTLEVITRRQITFREVSEVVRGKPKIVKKYFAPNTVLYKQSLNENQPEGNGQKLEVEAVTTQRIPITIRDPKTKKRVEIEDPDRSMAVLLEEPKSKEISDIIVMKVLRGDKQVEVFTFEMFSSSSDEKTPLDISDVKVPTVRVKETGQPQDITSLLFPIYSMQVDDDNGRQFSPPFKVIVTSDDK